MGVSERNFFFQYFETPPTSLWIAQKFYHHVKLQSFNQATMLMENMLMDQSPYNSSHIVSSLPQLEQLPVLSVMR